MKLSIAGSPKNRRRPQLGDRMRPQDMRETTGNFKVYWKSRVKKVKCWLRHSTVGVRGGVLPTGLYLEV